MKKGVGKIILGASIFVLSIILPVIIIVTMLIANDKGTKFQAPGSIEVNVEEVGKYSLSNNFATIYQGKSYSTSEDLPSGMTFILVNKNTGENVPMQTGLKSTTTSGSDKSASVGNFEITAPGKYVLTVSGNKQPRVFSFGKSQPLAFYGFILIGSFILVPLSFVAGLLLVIFGIINLVKGAQTTPTTPPPVRPSVKEGYTPEDYRD